MSASCWMLLLSFILPAVTGFCGYPGRPNDSNVLISYDALVQVANYTCDLFAIDGDTSRRCEQNGKWSGSMPRCGVQVNADQIKTSTNAEPKCNHLFSGQEINFEFKRNLRLIAVTLESPTLYAFSVAAQRWILMADGVSLDRPHTHGTKSSEWFITRWRLNDNASSLRLILQSDNFWLCNVTLHAYPDDCGHPEVPVHGHINLTKSEVIYSCDSGSKLVGNATRNCSEGRWSGGEPTCELLTDDELYSNCNACTWEGIGMGIVLGFLLVFLIILSYWKCYRLDTQENRTTEGEQSSRTTASSNQVSQSDNVLETAT